MWHLKQWKWLGVDFVLQWAWDGWVSLGGHVDFNRRTNSTTHEPYGPYVDLHFACFIFSFGRNPYGAQERR